MDFAAGNYVENGPSPFRVHEAEAKPGELSYAMWIHLAGLISWVVAVLSSGVAFFVPALVVMVMWFARRHDSVYIDDHGREALNFQISLVILGIAAVIVGLLLCGVGLVVTIPAFGLLSVVGSIMGAVSAHRGEYFRYPACIRFIR
jgi:uncharacterized protein